MRDKQNQPNREVVFWGHEKLIDLTSLMYGLTEKEKGGLCLGIVGAALISIYGSGFGLLKMSRDPTSINENELCGLLEYHNGCIQYGERIFYVDPKGKRGEKLTELFKGDKGLQSILNALPDDKLRLATTNELETISVSLGRPISKLQLFHDVFGDALQRVEKYWEEARKIEGEENKKNLVKSLVENDHTVQAFLETIMLITYPRERALPMLAKQVEKPSDGLPQQVLEKNILEGRDYIHSMLALLEPADIKAIDEVAPIGNYSRKDLAEFFSPFAEYLRAGGKPLNYPVSLVLRSYEHAMLVSIDPAQENQIVIRPNFLHRQEATLENMATCPTNEFSIEEGREPLSIKVYAHASDYEFTKKQVLQWRASNQFVELHRRGYQADSSEREEEDRCFLLAICDSNPVKAIDELLKMGFDPNTPIRMNQLAETKTLRYQSGEMSPLEFAIEAKKYDCAKFLLDSPLTKVDDRLLYSAICANNMELVSVLVESGRINLNSARYYENDMTASSFLMTALSRGNLELVRYLIEHGADVNYDDLTMGNTALAYAIHQNLPVEAVSLLLEYGAKMYGDENDIHSNTAELSELLSGKKHDLFFSVELKKAYEQRRKDAVPDLWLRQNMNSLIARKNTVAVDNSRAVAKSIHNAIYSARRYEIMAADLTPSIYLGRGDCDTEEEALELVGRQRKEYDQVRDRYLNKIVDFLQKDLKRFEQFTNRTGLLFDKDMVTEAMYDDLTRKLKPSYTDFRKPEEAEIKSQEQRLNADTQADRTYNTDMNSEKSSRPRPVEQSEKSMIVEEKLSDDIKNLSPGAQADRTHPTNMNSDEGSSQPKAAQSKERLILDERLRQEMNDVNDLAAQIDDAWEINAYLNNLLATVEISATAAERFEKISEQVAKAQNRLQKPLDIKNPGEFIKKTTEVLEKINAYNNKNYRPTTEEYLIADQALRYALEELAKDIKDDEFHTHMNALLFTQTSSMSTEEQHDAISKKVLDAREYLLKQQPSKSVQFFQESPDKFDANFIARATKLLDEISTYNDNKSSFTVHG